MKKYLIISAVCLAMIVSLNAPASATGIGAYGGFSYNEGTFQKYSGFDDVGSPYKVKYYWAGAGLVYDSAVAKNKLFNYRMNLGIGQLWQEPISGEYDIELEGIRAELISSFGFGIVKMSFMRLWLGPQLGLRVSYIEADALNTNFTSVFISPGAVVGFNFNIGSLFTIALDGGFRYNVGLNFVTAQGEENIFNYDSEYTYGPEGFVNLSILFRIDDNQERTQKAKEKQETKESEPEKEKSEKSENKSDKESDKGSEKNKISSDDDYWFGN